MEIFKNLKVIELASVLAGPAVGMFFVELGAEVIKIENATTNGDVTRKWKLPTENPNASQSAYYSAVNWQKEVIFADLTTETDQNRIHNLIKTADIVISNFNKKSAQKLRMDYETLKAINPKLIFAQLTAFGENDDTPAFDVVLQAEAGFLYMTGEPDREPVKMPVALIDLLAAHQLKEGVLVAMLQRERTGEGSYVTVSLVDAAIASLANQATNWLMGNHIPQRMGTMHPNIAPYGDVFYTSDDKPIVLAVGTERQFRNLCSVLNLSELIKNKQFKTNMVRVQNRESLKNILAKAIKKYERTDILNLLKIKKVPVGSIRNMKEVFELEAAKRMILRETLEDGTVTERVRTVVFDLKSSTD
ncbi:MAG: crotonobetainyl-CoA:carnitine CoA-transferase CaiB-like acyl-CoA transferase [Saprospiraceae bacterium]|jgi:crotonobetainyl-CoA:carnitine CoA-transferase CaiB-like acyl-CoA transferase